MKKRVKDIMLYSFDIDGTSNKNTYNLHIHEEETRSVKQTFPKHFVQTLIKLKTSKPQVKLMITTGRSIDLVEPLFEHLPWINNEPLFSYVGCVNGAFIYKWDVNTHTYKLVKKFNGMNKDVATKVLKVIESLNLPVFVQTKNLNRYYIKKNFNDEKYDCGVKLKNWTNKHITYKEFYDHVHEDILGMVLDTYLIARPPLSDADKYVYNKSFIHKHQRNRFNDKYMFSQTLKELHRKNKVPKRTSVLVSGTNTVDISKITKADALKAVIEDLGIERSQVSHSGDNFNDLPAWKFLRSKGLEDIKYYGKKRGICNAMSNTWDHLKLVTGDHIVETNTVSDFVELSINYDKIKHFLLWDKTNALSKEKRVELQKKLCQKYSEDKLDFAWITSYYNSDKIVDINRENTMIIQINKMGSKTDNQVLKRFVKELQLNKRIAKMHVYYDAEVTL